MRSLNRSFLLVQWSFSWFRHIATRRVLCSESRVQAGELMYKVGCNNADQRSQRVRQASHEALARLRDEQRCSRAGEGFDGALLEEELEGEAGVFMQPSSVMPCSVALPRRRASQPFCGESLRAHGNQLIQGCFCFNQLNQACVFFVSIISLQPLELVLHVSKSKSPFGYGFRGVVEPFMPQTP